MSEVREKSKLFSEMPVRKAVLTLAIPTVISQLITVVYNMADTFFIGQLGDPRQVAAATIAMPCFMFLTAFANLFGLGGSSLISRCLGSGDREKAKRCASFCIWTGAAAALIYGLLVVLAEPALLPILGASEETWTYCGQYMLWTIGIGAVPTVMNAELAHLIRAEGYSKPAGFGVAFGGILNILLDPLFIFVFRLEIAGAAIATMLSNLIAMGYFLL
ncbi:MAG: MATE family efflux transporter, partial [Clostridia bacterium]|nr:MATE family efflux transporter [Clostridia bacterium]